jgi:hypothetical protein
LLTLFVGVTLTAKLLGLVVLTVAPTGTGRGAFGPLGPSMPLWGTAGRRSDPRCV